MDGQRRGDTAQSLGTDADAVDPLQKFGFQFRHLRIGAGLPHLPQQRMLGQQHRLFRRAADAHADDDRRAGIGPRFAHRFDDEINHPLAAIGRLEHRQPRHILATPALGDDGDFEFVAGYDGGVDHRRGVVAGVDAGGKGVLDYGLAQVAFFVAPAHALGDGLVQIAADNVDILAQLDENDRQAAVLAEGHLLVAGDVGVFQNLVQHFAAHRRDFRLPVAAQRGQHILAQVVVALDTQPGNRFRDLVGMDLFHTPTPS